MGRTVTEQDFRMPEFRHAKPEDYEFREDGKLVRKDRWEMAVQSMRVLVGLDGQEFEIEEVLERVRALVNQEEEWVDLREEAPDQGAVVDVRLPDGSTLVGAVYEKAQRDFQWKCGGTLLHFGWSDVLAWKDSDSGAV